MMNSSIYLIIKNEKGVHILKAEVCHIAMHWIDLVLYTLPCITIKIKNISCFKFPKSIIDYE